MLYKKSREKISYEVSWLAVFTYKIRRNDVGIIINNAVAISPRILTSITFFLIKINFFNILKKW